MIQGGIDGLWTYMFGSLRHRPRSMMNLWHDIISANAFASEKVNGRTDSILRHLAVISNKLSYKHLPGAEVEAA